MDFTFITQRNASHQVSTPLILHTTVIKLGSVLPATHFWALGFLRELFRQCLFNSYRIWEILPIKAGKQFTNSTIGAF